MSTTTAPRLGERQLEVLRLMSSNYGGELPVGRRRYAREIKIAAGMAKHGLVEDALSGPLAGTGEPIWRITTDGRIAAERSRADKPEICFRCDKRPAVYVQFSGAQSGKEIGYPTAHLLCQHCYDEDRKNWPSRPPRRCYRMVPVDQQPPS
jgi:hypothetical protein